MDIQLLSCKQCGHTWLPRRLEAPKTCPNRFCHSTRWNEAGKYVKKVDWSLLREIRENEN